ncbi:hypothetical protein ACFWIJ_42770 [Streptomyces sp. NPDC127079]|uniref:hypothetical protein n=1 Tax=Streptomyces sp. NPDC127079 TaxID=3347132 RepID=UPI0036689BB2
MDVTLHPTSAVTKPADLRRQSAKQFAVDRPPSVRGRQLEQQLLRISCKNPTQDGLSATVKMRYCG